MEFSGPATRFTQGAIETAAAALGCEVAAVKAVIDVESRGGFLDDSRPKILFERHLFHNFTNGRHSGAHPDISSSRPRGYVGGAGEYDRLGRAIALDRQAALKSASWGAFQILGSNHKAAGYDNVEDFCQGMCESEDKQLAAFVGFVKSNHLDDELRRHDWAGFARGYNGRNFRENRYDEKLAEAYRRHSAGGARTDAGAARTLRMGDVGDDVERLQHRLGIAADGDFGPATKQAVIEFQRGKGLTADGVAGPRTLAAFG
jgi:hypothetical protein